MSQEERLSVVPARIVPKKDYLVLGRATLLSCSVSYFVLCTRERKEHRASFFSFFFRELFVICIYRCCFCRPDEAPHGGEGKGEGEEDDDDDDDEDDMEHDADGSGVRGSNSKGGDGGGGGRRGGGRSKADTRRGVDLPPSGTEVRAFVNLFEDIAVNPPQDAVLRQHWDTWVKEDVGKHNTRQNRQVGVVRLGRVGAVDFALEPRCRWYSRF